MKLKPFHGLNPAAAYRRYGARYSFFVFLQLAVLSLNMVLAAVTLAASYGDWELYAWCEKAATVSLKLVGGALPFLFFEALYWRYRLRRIEKSSL